MARVSKYREWYNSHEDGFAIIAWELSSVAGAVNNGLEMGASLLK